MEWPGTSDTAWPGTPDSGANAAWPGKIEAPETPKTSDDMPSPWEAVYHGMKAGLSDVGQSAQVAEGQKPTVQPETGPETKPLEWGDVLSPYSQLLPKVGYQLGKSGPTVAGGVAGGLALSEAGPWGTLAGGAGGAAIGAALQEIGPSFAQELQKSPNDPDGAWTRALEHTGIGSASAAAGWALFPARFFNGPVKNLAFQVLGVQPGVSVAEQAAQNVVSGDPATQGLGQAYAQGVAGTAVPMLGHAAMKAIRPGEAPPARPVEPPVEPPVEAPPQGELALGDINPDMRVAHETIDRESPPPPAPVPVEPSRWDNVPFVGQLRSMVDGWKKTFQPELMSDLSLQSYGFFREMYSKIAQGKDSTLDTLEPMRRFFQSQRPEDNVAFMKAYEENRALPPELAPYANTISHLMNWVHEADKTVNSKVGWLENYLPHEWNEPADRVANYFQNRLKGLGRPDFDKARTFDLIQDGLDAGFTLKTTNPVDLVTNRLMSSVEMRAKTELMKQLNTVGAARKITDPGMASDYARAGWLEVKNPTGGDWAIHPDIQPLWANSIAANSLWNNRGQAGNIFRGWMAFKNAWVPIKLGLSLFHPLHVAHISMVDGMARGWSQLKAGDPVGAIQSAAKGLYGQVQAAIPYMPHQGKEARAAWLTPEWASDQLNPVQQGMRKLMIEGGFSPQLAEQLRMKGAKSFHDALDQQNWVKAIPLGLLEGLRKSQAAIFEHWIPSLKTSAYLDEAKALFDRRPDLLDDEVGRRAALGTIAKSIDNRFGEMFYSNLFWNRTLKDVGIGSFLSLGWNLGFLREFGGGLLEPAIKPLLDQTPTRQAVNAAKNKTAFALFYMTNAMILNGLMTKGLTGQNPDQLMDYFLPRMGGNNPDGSPRRLSNMFYTREIPMAIKHIEDRESGSLGPRAILSGLGEMLWNKMMLEPINELINNRDYYGYNIMDEASPWYQQAYQLGKYILSDQFNPITISGAKRALQASGKWDDAHPLESYKKILTEPEGQLAMAGFGPAPTYASKTADQNRLSNLYGRYVSPQERAQGDRETMETRRDARNQMMLAQQKGDQEAISQAAQRLHELGLTSKQISQQTKPGTSDIYQYKRLPQSIQSSFLKTVSKDSFLRYYPSSAKKTKTDPEIQALKSKYYGQ